MAIFLHESKYMNNFWTASPKDNMCQLIFKSALELIFRNFTTNQNVVTVAAAGHPRTIWSPKDHLVTQGPFGHPRTIWSPKDHLYHFILKLPFIVHDLHVILYTWEKLAPLPLYQMLDRSEYVWHSWKMVTQRPYVPFFFKSVLQCLTISFLQVMLSHRSR